MNLSILYFLVPLVLIPLRIMNSTDILICSTNILLLIRWWLEQRLTANRYPAFACLLFAIYWSGSCQPSGWAGAGRHVRQVEARVPCSFFGLWLLHETCLDASRAWSPTSNFDSPIQLIVHHSTCMLIFVALIHKHTYHPVMMYLFLVATLLRFAYSKTSGQLCSGTAELSNGNWYCSEVRAITYRNISQPGVYNRTTYVDPDTGLCGHERLDYPATGSLTPLFGEVNAVTCQPRDRSADVD